MSNILLLTFLGLPRLRQVRGIFALENLHTGLFIDADHQAVLLVEAQRVDIEVTDRPRLERKRRVMAIEPVHASMRFQVGVVQYPPDCRAAHHPARRVVTERSRDIAEAPPRGWTVVGGWFTSSDRQNVDLFSG